ncbi:hypothetical protein PLICRDRAFT_107458, partial [Plicaturopsis crispa FD-325 SS-3]
SFHKHSLLYVYFELRPSKVVDMQDTVASTYSPECTLRNSHTNGVNCMAFSPSGQFLATGGDDCALAIWDITTQQQIFRVLTEGPVLCLCWESRSPRALFVGSGNKATFIENFEDGYDNAHEVKTGINAPVYTLAFDVESGFLGLAAGSEVQVLREINSTQNRRVFSTFTIMPRPNLLSNLPEEDHESIRGRSVHFTHRGTRLVVSYLSHGINCYDTHSGAVLWTIVPIHQLPIPIPLFLPRPRLVLSRSGSSAISPDGRRLLVTNLQDGVDMYPSAQSQIVQIYRYNSHYNHEAESNVPVCVSFVHGGKHVIAGSNYGEAYIWDTETGEIWQILPHSGGDTKICFAQTHEYYDYSLIATGNAGDDAYIRIWKASLGRQHLHDMSNKYRCLLLRIQLLVARSPACAPYCRQW